jgi:hypothetical protein
VLEEIRLSTYSLVITLDSRRLTIELSDAIPVSLPRVPLICLHLSLVLPLFVGALPKVLPDAPEVRCEMS